MFKFIPSKGGDVGPALLTKVTSSPMNLIENALRLLELLLPVEPCTVLKLNNTASPNSKSGINIFSLNSFYEGRSMNELLF